MPVPLTQTHNPHPAATQTEVPKKEDGAPKMSPSTFSLPGVQGEAYAREPLRSAPSLTRSPSSATLPSWASLVRLYLLFPGPCLWRGGQGIRGQEAGAGGSSGGLSQPSPGSFKAGWGWTGPPPAARVQGAFPPRLVCPDFATWAQLSSDTSLEGAIGLAKTVAHTLGKQLSCPSPCFGEGAAPGPLAADSWWPASPLPASSRTNPELSCEPGKAGTEGWRDHASEPQLAKFPRASELGWAQSRLPREKQQHACPPQRQETAPWHQGHSGCHTLPFPPSSASASHPFLSLQTQTRGSG